MWALIEASKLPLLSFGKPEIILDEQWKLQHGIIVKTNLGKMNNNFWCAFTFSPSDEIAFRKVRIEKAN